MLGRTGRRSKQGNIAMTDHATIHVSTSDCETWVTLSRFIDGEWASLFIARCKYSTGKTRAGRWKRAVEKNFNLATVTQEELDAFRDKVNEIKHEEFVAARGFSDEAITPAEYKEIEKAAWRRVGITVR
jgi:hypothetical protein